MCTAQQNRHFSLLINEHPQHIQKHQPQVPAHLQHNTVPQSPQHFHSVSYSEGESASSCSGILLRCLLFKPITRAATVRAIELIIANLWIDYT